jgi:iron-sulfur cluster assembly protein
MIREDVITRVPVAPVIATPILISATAAQKLMEVRDQKGLASAGLRVFVSGGGCSGLQYGMAFETEGEPDDIVFESAGVSVYVDPVSITYLQGATIDYVDTLMGGGFKIENPNAVSSCGCGHSFKTGGEAGAAESAGGGGCGSGCGSH